MAACCYTCPIWTFLSIRFHQNKRKTARSLEIAESTLYKKIKDYGLGKDEED